MNALHPPTVTGIVAAQARRRPSAAAIHCGDATLSFAQLEAMGRRAARGLADLGISPDDKVALWLPNTPAYLILCLACARLGAVAVAVNTRYRSADVGDVIGRSGAKLLVLWPGFREIDFLGILADVDAAALAGLETVVLYDQGGARKSLPSALGRCRAVAYRELTAKAAYADDHAHPGAPCNMFTTSGTTKAPKLVLHDQAGIAVHARQVAADFGFSGTAGAVLVPLPLCGVFGFTPAMAALAGGRAVVLMAAFDAAEAIALMRRHAVDQTNLSDDMVAAILDATDAEPALPGVRFAGFGAFNAGLGDIVARAARRGLTLVGLYGMSEVQALFARRSAAAPLAMRAIAGGRPVAPDGAVRVRDPRSGTLLAAGQVGELEVRGPSRMVAYFGDRGATAEALCDDGFLRTGDFGMIEPGGSFAFIARRGDVLRLGGFLVAPAEIESHIRNHATVSGAQVVGVETSGGPKAVGFVTLAPGAAFDEGALIDHCRHGLARYKAPLRIIPLDAFPVTRSANGTKIQRAELRRLAIKKTKKEG